MSKRSKSLKIENIEVKMSRREKAAAWLSKNVFGVKVEKTMQRQPSFVFEPEPTIRRPFYDYVNLYEVACNSWPLRRAFRAIIQESVRNWVSIVPKFKWKCTKCGKEYQSTPDNKKCTVENCKGDLIEPSEEQRQKFQALIDKPNRDYGFKDFMKSSIFYDLALDDFYWIIAYKYTPKTDKNNPVITDGQLMYDKEPAEIYVEDTRYLFPIADEYGHLGGYDWFCPNCYDLPEFPGDSPVVAIRPEESEEEQQKKKVCEYCSGPMLQTAYVEEVNGTVLARFTKDEVIHGSSASVKPALFGNSMIVSVWKIVNTILSMDNYNWEVYSKGKVGSIMGFPGEDQFEVDEKKTAIEEELRSLDSEDIQTGRYRTSPAIRTLFIGLKKDEKPIRIPIMEDLKAMQSLEFYKVYTEAVGEVYGVSPEFVSTSGPGGK